MSLLISEASFIIFEFIFNKRFISFLNLSPKLIWANLIAKIALSLLSKEYPTR